MSDILMYIILFGFHRITMKLAFVPPYDKRGNRVSKLFGNMSYQSDIQVRVSEPNFQFFFLFRQYIPVFQFLEPQATLISIYNEDLQSIIDRTLYQRKLKNLHLHMLFWL